jgi:DNA-directed RNA polymerase subunit beta'
VRDAKNKPLAAYSIPVGAQIAVNEGDIIQPGALLAKTPRQASKTKDITGGLPRVAELFEARRPKDAAEMSRIDGIVSFEGTVRGKRKLVVKNDETSQEEEHLIATGKHIIVQPATWSTRASTLRKAPLIRTKSWKSSGRPRSMTS